MADYHQAVQWRRVRHDEDHVPIRPCARNSSRSARSCCRSDTE
jgi:hypothetical protein